MRAIVIFLLVTMAAPAVATQTSEAVKMSQSHERLAMTTMEWQTSNRLMGSMGSSNMSIRDDVSMKSFTKVALERFQTHQFATKSDYTLSREQ